MEEETGKMNGQRLSKWKKKKRLRKKKEFTLITISGTTSIASISLWLFFSKVFIPPLPHHILTYKVCARGGCCAWNNNNNLLWWLFIRLMISSLKSIDRSTFVIWMKCVKLSGGFFFRVVLFVLCIVRSISLSRIFRFQTDNKFRLVWKEFGEKFRVLYDALFIDNNW